MWCESMTMTAYDRNTKDVQVSIMSNKFVLDY